MIHASTSEVYGTARYAPMDESHPLQGQSPYSASKIGADKLVESFYCAYGLPVVTVRPFNTFGPRQSGRAVIPAIITQALAGETIQLGNLDTTRDFTYVDDTVDGFLKAAETSQIEGQVFNLGTGQEIRVGELAEKIMQMVGRQVEVKKDRRACAPINRKFYVFCRIIRWQSKSLNGNPASRWTKGWRAPSNGSVPILIYIRLANMNSRMGKQ